MPTLRSLIDAELPDLVSIRHDLHRHPELMYQEHRTSGVVRRELEAAGVAFRADLAGGTGVLGHLPGDGPDAVGLRADMDALPIEEMTGATYASETAGVMHACGHDGHTAILIGAARVLAKIAAEGPLPNPVTLVFQPAEEGGAGGERMVQDGALNGTVLGPAVKRIYGLHGWPGLDLGTVATRPGPLLAAADMFEVTVEGTGGHAAFPHRTNDPILAAAAIVQSIQQIVARNHDPLDAVVVSVTQFHAGTTHNIIPGDVRLSGTVRTLSTESQTLTRKRLHDVVTSVATAHGCDATVEYHVGYPVTLNDPAAVGTFRTIATDALGADRVQPVPRPFMGAEDFAYYGQSASACFFLLGLLPAGAEATPQLHQAEFDFNDNAIGTGVEMMCRLALGEVGNVETSKRRNVETGETARGG